MTLFWPKQMSFKNAKNSSFLENRAAHHARFATSGSSVIGLYFQKMLHWYFQYLMYFERAAVIRFYLSLNLKSEVVDKKKIKYFCSFQHLFKHFITHFWLNLISSWGFFLGFISKFCWSFISHVTWIKFTISSTWHNCSWWRFQQHCFKIVSKTCQSKYWCKMIEYYKTQLFVAFILTFNIFSRNKWVNFKNWLSFKW